MKKTEFFKNKNNKAIVLTALFISFILVPLALFPFYNSGENRLYGEKNEEIPRLSPESFFSGEFQKSFEDWFSKNYPLRTEIVKLYNTMDKYKDNISLLELLPAQIETQETHTQETPTLEIPSNSEKEAPSGPRFPEYVLENEPLTEPSGYKGTDWVVIGKSGCLFENGYINEFLGTSQKYKDTTDETLFSRAESLKTIQDKLTEMGKCFVVVITPSKAAYMSEYIPDFYTAKFTLDKNYIRPYVRFKEALSEFGVNYIDSSEVFKSAGLTNIFPKTGIHWNKFAAFEVTAAIIEEYQRQSGIEIRSIKAVKAIKSVEIPGYGSPENDIFGILYSGRDSSDAIIDEWYYDLEISPDNRDNPKIKNMLVQGGSFTGDLDYFFTEYGIAEKYEKIYYNNSGYVSSVWEERIESVDFIVLEVNEQYVYGMGGYPPSWGQNDLLPAKYDPETNIVDALYRYLTK